MKRKWTYRILGWLYGLALWAHPWPWPWSFKVRVWNSLFSGIDYLIDMNKKDVSHPYMAMVLSSVTMVGWADVPDSDRGDFRCQRAIDISNYTYYRSLLVANSSATIELYQKIYKTSSDKKSYFCFMVTEADLAAFTMVNLGLSLLIGDSGIPWPVSI